MTNNELILWLKGFTEGVHEYSVTPKQWDLLKERLSEVDDENRTQKVWGGETTGSSSTAVMYTTSGGPNWYATYFNDLKTDDNDR